MTTTLKIDGMNCSHCVASAKKALESVSGVISADVTLEPGMAKVEHNPEVTREQLAQAVIDEEFRIVEG
ncbi:MAG: cation transporter [Fimbriimonadaceae bacterium]|nr:cation transporter [Fimbriimonadaceae bacterium]